MKHNNDKSLHYERIRKELEFEGINIKNMYMQEYEQWQHHSV